jgi:V8-like Glu-specific endopeptidase
MTAFCGSAFLIGSRGVALTAAHLLSDGPEDEHMALMAVDSDVG